MFCVKRILISVILLAMATVMFGCGEGNRKKAAMVEKWDRTTAIARVPIAMELAANSKYEEAAALLEKCVLAAPESPVVHLEMGKVYLMQSMFSPAQNSLRKAVKIDDSLDEAWYMLGVIAEGEGSEKNAFSCYARAMDLKPSRVGYVMATAELKADMDDHAGAVAILREKSEMLYAPSEMKVALAEMLVRQGQVDEAIIVYNRLLAGDGDRSEYLERLGHCYVINKNWAEGSRMFSRLVDLTDGQKRDDYLEMLGMCSMNNADYVRAMKCYDSLSVKRRDDADVWLSMGQAAFGANIPKRALRCAERAYSLKPGNSDAIMLKGCAEYAKGDYAKAFESFAKISGKSESAPFVEMMMNRCNEHLGKDM